MGKQLFFLLILLAGCVKSERQKLVDVLQEVKSEYAPDSRLKVFELEPQISNGKWEIKGVTTEEGVKTALEESLKNFTEEVNFDIKVLPDSALETEGYGIINNSVVNMRVKFGYSSGMAKQALLGEEIKLLEENGGWYRAKTSDGYISWIPSGAFTKVNTEEFTKWKNAPKVIYTQKYGNSKSLENPSAQVSDLVYGNLLKLEEENNKEYIVSYPDGRKASIQKSEAILLNDWVTTRELTKENLLETAHTFMGLPYFWGGNSYKGVDCSGFTGTVYQMNGLELPRDASLQVFEGVEIDTLAQFSKLEVGDLLFFGERKTAEKKERVVHVGMWIGEGKFIHSQGQVRISSFRKEDKEFDEYNLDRFLRVKRILGNDQRKLTRTLEQQFLAK